MGFALNLALRYMRSKKRDFISVSTVFAILGVALGTAALVAVMSVTGGFRAEFQKKVLGVNAHVMILRASFRDYREVMEKVRRIPEVIGVAPFVLNPMMITHAGHTATGVLLKGVEPDMVGSVLDLPEQMVAGSLDGLRPVRSSQAAGVSEPVPQPAPQPPGAVPASSLELDLLGLGPAEVPARSRPSAVSRPAPASSDDGRVVLEPGDLPRGSIVPEGGYASELPSSDVLPEDIDPDPCRGADAELPGIVLGFALRQTLAADLGDCVQVTSPTIGYSFAGGQLRPPVAKQFRVIGVFQAGFEQYDSKLVYTDLREAQALYQEGDTVTGVEMKVVDVDRAREVAASIDAELGGKLYDVVDWMELNHGLFTALRIQQILMSLVLALIILVAAFTVIATLIMVVLDKKREIATIKAMGASDGLLLRTFLYQGLIIGVLGTGFGLAFGYVVCRWILAYGFPLDPKVYFIDHLPVQMRAFEFLLTGVFAILACLSATVWPAFHAARLRPAEAFREST
ncbi:MAG TPA: ABC transporter permease [Polyangiaceae bacterium]|nr:ABC transporter permease [Polyangiaceae bacterium]